MEVKKPIFIVLIIIIALLLLYFFTIPRYKEFKSLQSKLAILDSEVSSKYAYFAEITRVYDELQTRKESLEKVNEALPPASRYSSLVYFIQKKTAENGLILKSLAFTRVSASDKGENIKEITFSANAIGSYNSLKNLIRSLEKSASLVEVAVVSFSSQGDKSQEIFQFSLEFKMHSY
jgi:Tfp pilus assembly protein PilO